MESLKNYDLFLFDFDGLLVDTEGLHHKAYVRMCQARGVSLDWDFPQFCAIAHASSTALRETLQYLFPELQAIDWDVLYAEKKRAYMELLEEGALQLLPGATELLTLLQEKEIRRAVATHSPKEQIDRIKEHLPLLHSIPHWITREDYTHPKPAPDAYLTAIARIGKPEDRIIGFEDSHRGLTALQQTSALPVLIAPTRPNHLPPGTLHFPSLTEFLERDVYTKK